MKKFYVIDFMNLAFRNYHAFSKMNLTTSTGEPTGTLFGMASFLVNMIQMYSPDYIAVAMESDMSFRKAIFQDYKKNREGKPSDFENQLGSVKEMFKILGIPMIRLEGLEADDVVGCLVSQLGKDKSCRIVSGDKDFMQLVSNNVKLLMPKTGGRHEVASFEEVEKKFGCTPDQVVDVLAIMGDSVDCIPGVQGIGPKGASQLICEFGSLKNIYENISSDKISKSHREKLIKSAEVAFTSQHLAKIVCDVDIPLSDRDIEFNPSRLKSSDFLDFLEKYELKSIKNKIFVKLGGLD